MSRRSATPALLAILLAACGQPGQPGQAPAGAAPTSPPARAASAATPAGARPGNFTALALGKSAIGAGAAGAAVPRGTATAPVHMNEALGVPSFLWAQPGPAGTVASARAGAGALGLRSPVEAARAHLAGAAAAYRLGARDAAAAEVARVHDTGRGPIVVTFRQRPGGVEVFGETASVLMARDLSLVALSGALSPSDPESAALGAGTWTLDAPAALAAALTDLTGEAFAAGDFEATAPLGGYQGWNLRPAVADARGERFLRPAALKRTWFRLPGGLQAAWRVEVAMQRLGAAEKLVYGSVISAEDGVLLFRKDHAERDAYSYRVWASDVAPFLPDDGPQGLAGTPHPTGLADGSQPAVAARKLLTLESLPFSKNDPWLPPGSTNTFGNNVQAYADLAAPDGFDLGDLYGTTSSPGAFDWAYDTAAAPAATPDQVQAAITQLFYVGNALHDWFYDVGFDEAAGNAQNANLGRGGLQGDPLVMEAQDYNGLDNAQTFPQPDGISPKIEMFLWHNSDLVRALVTAPAGLAGAREARAATTFGPQSFDVTGDLVLASNTRVNPCPPFDNAAGFSGKIAVIERSPSLPCTFTSKVAAAQAAGAVGVLIRNIDATQSFVDMGGTDATIVIPSLLVRKADGDALAAAALAGPTTLSLQRTAGTLRDGTVDSLVVAHEWGHYMSNRLVQDAAGLLTIQARGMGEGWSDFVSLLMAVRAEDVQVPDNAGWDGIYATAGWVMGGLDALGNPNQGFYYGLRRTPYSTDMTRAPLTFRHVADGVPLPAVSPPLISNGAPNSEVHNAGEVWAGVLWECYAGLLRDTQGPTPRLTFDGANQRMREYLVASLKLLPQYPTFLEGRDALLAVAKAADPVDFHAFWEAFAKRGFGVGAVGPSSRFTTTNAGVVESFGAGGQLAFVSATFGGVTSGCDDQDGTLDNGETGRLSITLRNFGSEALPAGTATISSTTPGVSFPGGGVVTLAPTALDGVSVATATVSLVGAAPSELAQLTITFPPGYLAQAVPVVFQLRTNVDVVRAAATVDDLEGDNFVWTPGVLLAPSTGERFQRIASSAVSHLLYGPDAETASDLTATSPPLDVGAGTFTASWRHLFWFEADPVGTPGRLFYDGGVVELSDDGGASWTDLEDATGATLYNGGISLTGFGNPLEGRRAFVDASPSAAAGGLDAFTVDLTNACAGGTPCAGKQVRLRFRVASDASVAGPRGWLIDDVAFGGITNSPFDLITNDARRCINRPPTASAGPAQAVDEGAAVTLVGTGSSDPDTGAVLSYAWTQSAGPAVTLAGAATDSPTFTAPPVDADTVLGFVLTVSDGTYTSSASTLVTVRNVNRLPVADAGQPLAADERTPVTLDGTASSDADPGTVLAYAWTQVGAPAVTLLGAGNARPSFVAPEVTVDTTLTFQLVVSDGLASSAPAEVTVTIRNVNRPPVAVAGPLQTVSEGATVTLTAAASSDPDAGTTLFYKWTQTGAPLVLLSADDVVSPTFTAPQVDADTLLTFQVLVRDAAAPGGLTATATTTVLVRDVNATPVARAGLAQTAAERTQVTLDGSGSSDADPNTVLAYTWTQVGTPAVTLIGADSAHPAFTAPEVGPAGATLTFSLVVSDGLATSAPSTVTVGVTNVNRPPTVTAGPDFDAPERTAVFLAAVAADADPASTFTVRWAQVGPSTVVLTGADGATASFTAPEVTAPTDLTFEVTVEDDQHAVTTARVVVTVTNVNRPPVAQAGAPQTVNAGTVVTLDAGASADPDAGAVLTYAWTQTAGPGVTLSGATTTAPTFTAPGGDATLTFEVIVSDGAEIRTATVTITVRGAKDSGGCGCSANGSNPAGLVPFLFGLAFLRRRRARPAAK